MEAHHLNVFDDLVDFWHAANLRSRVTKGAMTEKRYNEILSLLKGSLVYDEFRTVDLVIEVCSTLFWASMRGMAMYCNITMDPRLTVT